MKQVLMLATLVLVASSAARGASGQIFVKHNGSEQLRVYGTDTKMLELTFTLTSEGTSVCLMQGTGSFIVNGEIMPRASFWLETDDKGTDKDCSFMTIGPPSDHGMIAPGHTSLGKAFTKGSHTVRFMGIGGKDTNSYVNHLTLSVICASGGGSVTRMHHE